MARILSSRSWVLALALGATLLGGCASNYVVVLTDGQRLTAVRKPSLVESNGKFAFVFVDSQGNTNSIPSAQVRAVAPASALKPAP
ncbi:MAG: YgdI/YgdR family lipoprotein [Limisphaerales bacterium]